MQTRSVCPDSLGLFYVFFKGGFLVGPSATQINVHCLLGNKNETMRMTRVSPSAVKGVVFCKGLLRSIDRSNGAIIGDIPVKTYGAWLI